jgi:hypothetical protein
LVGPAPGEDAKEAGEGARLHFLMSYR